MFKSLEKFKLFLNNLSESQNKVQEYLPKYNHTQHPNSDYDLIKISKYAK